MSTVILDLLRRAAVGAIGAAAIGGLVEGGLALIGGGPAAAIPAAIGLWLLTVPLAMGALLTLLVAARLPPARALRRGLADEARRPAWLAGALVLGPGLALALGAQAALLQRIRAALTDTSLLVSLAPLVTALLLGLVLAGGLFVGPLIAAALRRLAPGPRVGWIVFAVAAASPLVTLWPLVDFVFRDVPLRPLGMLIAALPVALLLLRPIGWRRAALVVGVGAGLLALGVWSYERSSAARTALAAGLGLGHAVVLGVHAAVDGDGDGASPLLAGGDCDDADPTVHPAGVDLPGNGLDEDCDGADARVAGGRKRTTLERPTLPEALVRRWNVLLVTIDTVRADRLPIYGYARPTAPHLGRLAEQGWVVERAYTPANSTRYAFPALFAGRDLADIEVDWLGRHLYVRPGNALLFERLRAAGYRVEAHLPEQMTTGMWYGLHAGVDAYVGHPDATLKGRSVRAINRGALEAFDRFEERAGPWALWVHYLEPHEPYRTQRRHRFGRTSSDRYDGEIAAADAGLGALVAELEQRGWLDDTLIVVTSDHGEEFEEHGRRYHGKQLYEESVRVPLVIRVPGATPRRIATPALLQDITPTVAHLIGLRANLDYGARSLAGYGAGVEPEDPRRRLYMASYRNQRWPAAYQTALLTWPLKALRGRGGPQIYDLDADPGEQDNRVDEGGHPLIETLTGEQARRRLAIRRGLERRARTAPPAGMGPPSTVAPGLVFHGARVAPLDLGVVTLPRLDAWFEAQEGARPDVEFELILADPDGEVHTRYHRRPFAGLSSTRQWTPGPMQLSWLLRVREAVSGPVDVQLAARVDGQAVWGPVTVARVEGDALH